MGVVFNWVKVPVPLCDLTKGKHIVILSLFQFWFFRGLHATVWMLCLFHFSGKCIPDASVSQYILLTILKEANALVADQPAVKEPDWSILDWTVFLFDLRQVE